MWLCSVQYSNWNAVIREWMAATLCVVPLLFSLCISECSATVSIFNGSGVHCVVLPYFWEQIFYRYKEKLAVTWWGGGFLFQVWRLTQRSLCKRESLEVMNVSDSIMYSSEQFIHMDLPACVEALWSATAGFWLQLTVWSQEGEEIRAATKTCFCYSVKSKIHSDKMRNRIWWPSVIMFYVCCAHAGPCLQI